MTDFLDEIAPVWIAMQKAVTPTLAPRATVYTPPVVAKEKRKRDSHSGPVPTEGERRTVEVEYEIHETAGSFLKLLKRMREKSGLTIASVARKLSVLLHRLWVTGEIYEPLGYAKEAKVAA